jgi:hypothetical protein
MGDVVETNGRSSGETWDLVLSAKALRVDRRPVDTEDTLEIRRLRGYIFFLKS